MTILTEGEFEKKYDPLPSPDGSEVWRYEDTLAYPVEYVWTLVDGDETDNTYAIPGYHIVNRWGYAVTKKPWTDSMMQAIWSTPVENDR